MSRELTIKLPDLTEEQWQQVRDRGWRTPFVTPIIDAIVEAMRPLEVGDHVLWNGISYEIRYIESGPGRRTDYVVMAFDESGFIEGSSVIPGDLLSTDDRIPATMAHPDPELARLIQEEAEIEAQTEKVTVRLSKYLADVVRNTEPRDLAQSGAGLAILTQVSSKLNRPEEQP